MYELILPALHEKQALICKPRQEKVSVNIMGTKFGKTLGFSIKMIEKAISSPYMGREYLWGAPYYNSAKIGFKYFQRLVPKEIADFNKSDLSIHFPHNENTIFFKGVNTDPENTIEGNAYHHIVLDEASKMVEQAYNSARTTTTKTKAQIDLITTPRGKNWVYQLWLLGKNGDPDFVSYQFPTSANPFIDLEEIAKAKRSMPERLFQQYYEAMFVDVSMVFTQYTDCLYDCSYIQTSHDNELWINPEFRDSEKIVIGADWGKVNDSTVFTAWDYGKRKMVGFRRFLGYDYISAVKELIRFNNSFKRVELNWHDKTGVGIAMDDLLAETNLPYEGITFTNQSKSDMVNDLMFAFERKDIAIPDWQNMKLELDSFEVRPTDTGRLRYNAFDGMHDDIVCSMMLGHACMKEYAVSFDEAIFLDEIHKLKLKKNDYFDMINEDARDEEIWGN